MLAVSCAADADAHHTPGETETVLTAVMYHDVLASRTGTYIVSPEQLESDIAAFAEAGYSFVSPAQVIAYAEGRGRLPARPMLLTFDDGHYNNAYYGLPILRKYGAKATFCVVGSYADTYTERESERDNPAYSYLTWEEIGELSRDPLITIAAHSYDMHGAHGRRGILPKAGESDGDYERALTEDTERLREKLTECTGLRVPVRALLRRRARNAGRAGVQDVPDMQRGREHAALRRSVLHKTGVPLQPQRRLCDGKFSEKNTKMIWMKTCRCGL